MENIKKYLKNIEKREFKRDKKQIKNRLSRTFILTF